MLTDAYIKNAERAAAERIAMISWNPSSRAKLQTLLELDQRDLLPAHRAPLLSMLTGEADSRHTGAAAGMLEEAFGSSAAGAQFTCFTSTKVQVLTLYQYKCTNTDALLVHQYKD